MKEIKGDKDINNSVDEGYTKDVKCFLKEFGDEFGQDVCWRR